MATMKEFFAAGLAAETSREDRDSARKTLRKVAQERCPDELNALDKASDELKSAEEQFARVCGEIMQATMHEMEAGMRAAAIEQMKAHAAVCREDRCAIKAMLAEHTARVAGAN
jgi:DNA repair exonuclease SbcCD ATPase subunit